MKYLLIQGFEKIEGVSNYKLNLLPFPQELGEITGFFKLGAELGVFFQDVDPESEEVIIEVMTEELNTIGKFTCKKVEKALPKGLKLDKFQLETSNDETYALYFEEEYLIIMGLSDKGIYYGANTFLQLLKFIEGSLLIPQLEIFDYPAYEIRCIADQTSRNQVPTVANLKSVIKFLSRYKINYHYLYMEDGFNFKKYPDIGKACGGYTVEEIKEIQEYAKRYFIEIIPIFNMFGHVDNILMTNYPKYAHLGEFPGAASYDISNPEVRSFLEDLMEELCSAFDSSYFHLGLDETFDFGKYNTKQLVKEKGKGKLMLEFYSFLIETAKKYGKEKILCYHDNLLAEKELLRNLPKDLIIFYWNYWPKRLLFFDKKKYKKANKLRQNGFPVILSPTLYDYTRNFPDTKRTIKNVVSMARYGLEIGSLGIATSVWGDFLNENLRENNYFGYLVTAEATWSPQNWDEKRFKENFAILFYGTEDTDIIKVIDDLNVYNDLHGIYPLKFYCHIWRHPFPAKKIKPKIKKLDLILQKSEEALQLLGKLKVQRNVENLNYLVYAAKLGIYLVKKYKIAIEVQKQLNRGEIYYDSVKLIEKVTYLKESIEALKKEYKDLWLRCAKPNGLELILEKFDAASLFYLQKIQEIEEGIPWKDPYIKSEYITAPKKVKTGDPIFLRKTFFIKKPIKSCYIQGMCDILMHLYLNEEKLGEIVSKMALSVEPIKQRIQLFDVTDKVKTGSNVIAAECHNYLISRVAGNIYLEIEYESGEKEYILSNSDWKANDIPESNWTNLEFDDSHWGHAKSLGAPPKVSGHITKPHVQAGIKSQDLYYYAIGTFFKGLYPFIPLFLIEKGKSLLGMDIF